MLLVPPGPARTATHSSSLRHLHFDLMVTNRFRSRRRDYLVVQVSLLPGMTYASAYASELDVLEEFDHSLSDFFLVRLYRKVTCI